MPQAYKYQCQKVSEEFSQFLASRLFAWLFFFSMFCWFLFAVHLCLLFYFFHIVSFLFSLLDSSPEPKLWSKFVALLIEAESIWLAQAFQPLESEIVQNTEQEMLAQGSRISTLAVCE